MALPSLILAASHTVIAHTQISKSNPKSTSYLIPNQLYPYYLSYLRPQKTTTLLYSPLPYHTIPYHTIPCHAMPCHTIPYHTILYHTILYHTIPYYTIPYYAIPYYAPLLTTPRALCARAGTEPRVPAGGLACRPPRQDDVSYAVWVIIRIISMYIYIYSVLYYIYMRICVCICVYICIYIYIYICGLFFPPCMVAHMRHDVSYSSTDLLWTPSMGPYLISRDLKYEPVFGRFVAVYALNWTLGGS